MHRDLKPENIWITKDRRVKLLDFGLAKTHGPGLSDACDTLGMDESPATEAGAILGTVGYMAPEQVRGEAVDARSDLFSLGVVLYELLTGVRPFRGGCAAETLSAILRDEMPEPEAALKVPPSLKRLLERCLAKEPGARFQGAGDLAFALESLSHPSGSAPVIEAEKSIVVLPFENLSPDPDNAYFADGLTEELIADLSKVQALRVISRTSAMHFKGTDKALPEIAQALKVRYVLEGSVRRAGNSLRITAQLIEADTDTHLWAEKYTGTFDDIFDLQEKLSRSIVEALKVRLTPTEDHVLAARPIASPEAYEAYLRAYQEIMRWDPEALDRAEHHLDHATDLLGAHPQILAGRALVAFQRVNMGLAQEDMLEQARANARQALVMAPGLPQAHMALGMVAMLDGDFPMGVLHLRRARSETPGDTSVWGWLPWYLCCVGQSSQAATLAEEVLRLDPMDPNWHLLRAAIPVFAGDFGRGATLMAQALSMAPDNAMHRFWHAHALALAGSHREALLALPDSGLEAGADIWERAMHLLRATLEEAPDRFEALLTDTARRTLRRDNQFSYHLAQYLSRLGRPREALDWLGHAIDLTFVPVRLFECDPFLAPLRSHPRWPRLMDQARAIQAQVPLEA